jgi:hypothetical protein
MRDPPIRPWTDTHGATDPWDASPMDRPDKHLFDETSGRRAMPPECAIFSGSEQWVPSRFSETASGEQ